MLFGLLEKIESFHAVFRGPCLIIVGVCLSLSACGPKVFSLEEGQESALVVVKSPAGKPVSANIIVTGEDCNMQPYVLEPFETKGEAVKVYQVPAGTWVNLNHGFHGGSFHGYSCNTNALYRFHKNHRYLITMVADQAKRVCRNKISNRTDSSTPLVVSRLLSGKQLKQQAKIESSVFDQRCNLNLTKVEMQNGSTFDSPLFLNTMSFSSVGAGIIPTSNSVQLDQK